MNIYAKAGTTIHIGRVGENLATTVIFDISNWAKEYEEKGLEGMATLVIDKDGLTYPQSVTRYDNLIHWVVTKGNTEHAGMGKCELFYSVKDSDDDPDNDIVVKSAIYDFIVTNSLDAEEDAEPPEPFESWFEEVLIAANDIQSKINVATESATQATDAANYAESQANIAKSQASSASTSAKAAAGSATDSLNSANRASTSERNAAGSASSAGTFATNANNSAIAAQAAQGKAEDAQEAAESAQASAIAAQGKAIAAQTAAETAQGKAKTAQTAAENAKTAAEAAQAKAETAKVGLEAARTAAEAAQTKAEAAKNAAETAQNKAQSAQNQAQTAQTKAETAKAGAEEAQAKAETAKAAAETAQKNAQSAKTAAEAARDAAKTSANNASNSATSASSSATASATSATESASSAKSASDSAASALASKNAAESSKNAAKTSETNAKASETNAKNSASAASASETNAKNAETAAETAQEKAEAAQTKAESANNSANNSRKIAEAWAIGTMDGSVATAYAQNNSKYYAEQAKTSANIAEEYSGNPAKPENGTWWIWDASQKKYVNTGMRTILSIVKSYSSVVDMDKDLNNMKEGDLVIINSDTQQIDNAKLFIHSGTQWSYLSDLSGLQGVSIGNISRTSGNGAAGTTDTYTITLTDGNTHTFTVYNGKNGEGSGDMEIQDYDPNSEVSNAGGIPAYVESVATKISLKTWTAADVNN